MCNKCIYNAYIVISGNSNASLILIEGNTKLE